MKKIKLEEKFDPFFNENDFNNQQISVFQNEFALENIASSRKEEFLDKFLSAIKFIFLYIPGAMQLYLVGMFAELFILYSESFPNLLPELGAGALIGTFLTMLGIGKLRDLNYLKVPAAIFAMSFLLGIIHAIFTIFSGIETHGIYLLISLPIVIAWGYIVKRFMDKD